MITPLKGRLFGVKVGFSVYSFSKLLFEEAPLVTVGCRRLVQGLGFPREPTPFMRHSPRVRHGSQTLTIGP